MADSYNELFGLGSHLSADANLEAWFLLQDDAADYVIADETGNGTGELNAATGGRTTATLSAAGPNSWLPKALDLNGTSDFAEISGLVALTGALSIHAFAKPDDASDNVVYVTGKGDGNYSGQWLSSGVNNYFTDAVGFVAGSTSVSTAGSWSTLSVTRSSGSAVTVYLDSVSDGTGSQGSLSSGNHLIGHRDESPFGPAKRSFFDGSLAHITAWSRVLSASESLEIDDGPEPVNSVAPAISGTETEGQTLSTTTGTWGLDAPFSAGSNGTITYSYQWTRSNDAGGTGEADISGATSSTYTLTASDVGKFIRCRVAASNDGGNDSAADTNSAMSGAIAASGGGGTPLPVRYRPLSLPMVLPGI